MSQVLRSDAWFRTAAILCLLAMVAHELLGAPMVLPPLADAELDEEIVWLHHFSWHVGTVATAAIAFMFFYASIRPGNLALAIVATCISTGFCLLGVGLAVFASPSLWGTPAPYLWSLVAVIGLLGVWQSSRAISP